MPTFHPPRDLLADRAHTTPLTTALIDHPTNTSWTYRELSALTDQYCTALSSQSIQAGDHVGTIMQTRHEFVCLFHAINRLGAVLIPLNPSTSPAQLRDQLLHGDVDYLVCDTGTETKASSFDIPLLSIDESQLAPTIQLTPEPPNQPSVASSQSTEFQLLFFTSGTTGHPKAVPITRTNLFASATASAFRLGLSPTDRWLCCLPLYHMGGIAPIYRSTLYGTTIVLQHTFDVTETPRALTQHTITGISLVPTMLHRLLETDWTPPSSLRFILLGGAAAPPTLITKCHERNIPVFPSYGMTETTSQIATADPETAYSNPGTVGHPLIFTDITIVTDNEPAPAGTQGEITVQGPTVTSEYYNNPDATQNAFSDYGLHTGDIGSLDDNGLLYINHRESDTITTGGETITPEIITTTLKKHPAISDGTVIGLDDPEWGQRIVALLTTTRPVTEQDIQHYCQDHLTDYQCPKTIKFIDELPRTPSGTIDRTAVKTYFST